MTIAEIAFSPTFADIIKIGEKTATIRSTAKCRPGDQINFRYENGEIFAKGWCIDVNPIDIYRDRFTWHSNPDAVWRYRSFSSYEDEVLDRLAASLGFRKWIDALRYYYRRKGLPYKGYFHTFIINDFDIFGRRKDA